MLELRKISKDYVTSSETVKALKEVDLTFRDKEFVSILGPSGCGKTTMLNIVGGLDHYTSGDLIINGRSTRSYKDRDWDVYRNHRVGFIFQSYNLIPHQTILGNVELALTISGIGKSERVARAKRALDRVGLSGQYNKKPNQLSGGQCQRVAIARALVNDPEILLADEPTGALDTVTSVQIMDLIREIADERLVIMVTHNPELAEQYSTRIIRLLDGRVVEDSNPVSKEELDEYTARLEAEKSRTVSIRPLRTARGEVSTVADAKQKKKKDKKAPKGARREKAKMSFFTAFRLSAKNLISKKGRTSMVGFAGSIGIIGIAMVLAFSSGIKGYVKSMQDDMLSGNPIQITETTYDLEALTGMMSTSEKVEIIKEPGKVYINSLVEYIAMMSDRMNSLIIKNDISENYIKYVTEMPEEYYSAMLLDYGIDMSNSIYTEFEAKGEKKPLSISALTNIYTSILQSTEYSAYASYITQIVPSFKQAPNNKDYLAAQYDVIGEIADEYDEVMLVLDRNEEISDLLLARLGYYSEEEFFAIIDKAVAGEDAEGGEHYRKYFTNEELLGKTFTWYPNDEIFKKNEISFGGTTMINPQNPFSYAYNAEGTDPAEGVNLKVVGILYANETTTYGCLTSGIYYTEALTEHVLEKNMSSDIVEYLLLDTTANNQITSMNVSGMNIGIYYNYDFTAYGGETKTATAFVGSSLGIDDMLGSMGNMGGGGSSGGGSGGAGGGMGSGGSIDVSLIGSMKTLSARDVGGVDVANAVSIYPISFESKDLVTNYLDKWNGKGDITLGKGTPSELVITASERSDVTYTDALELVINLINGMIDVVSAALIAFTSISLVVSTVMIGIITYVSVVERIKEIGVIRSLGGRKKDVSRLFTAETFIIGLLSGLIGIGVTFLLSLLASFIIKSLFGIPNIATLEPMHAIILVLLSIVLTLFSGVMPARSAAKKDPVVALRTE
ncbi:MAG: ABC transporter ATP-binding protein/permease [Clostridia bacterium]|nr:ABC transporter ATP-binding protein/permease [Clostridia bacterium]